MMDLLSGRPFVSSLSRAYEMYAWKGGGGWSGGGPRPMYAFSKIKNDNKLFQQNHHFNAFLIVCFLGEGGGLQKEYVLYAREGDKENGRPPKGNSYIYIWPSLFGSTLK